MVALMLAFLILAPASSLFGRRLVFGIIAVLVNFVLLGLMYISYKKNPYTNFDDVPLAMFCVWAVYLLIRVI